MRDNRRRWGVVVGVVVVALFLLVVADPALAVTSSTTFSNFTEIMSWKAHDYEVRSVAWSPDGTKIASSSEDGTVKIWDAKTGNLLRVLWRSPSWVDSVTWSPNGSKVAAGGGVGVRIWIVDSGQKIDGAPGSERLIAWNPNGDSLISGSSGGWQVMLSTPDGDVLSITPLTAGLLGETPDIGMPFSWSPDGGKVAISLNDGSTQIWDSKLTRVLKILNGTKGSLSWSKDGKKIATGSPNGTVKVWNLDKNVAFETGTGGTKAIAFNPDGNSIASGSGSNISILNSTSGKLLLTLFGHRGEVLSVSWNPDGTRLTSGSADLAIKIWGVGGAGQKPTPSFEIVLALIVFILLAIFFMISRPKNK